VTIESILYPKKGKADFYGVRLSMNSETYTCDLRLALLLKELLVP
jgi:hypothetical protein